MPKEIERKFLVTGKEWRKRAHRGKAIRQAYLALTNTISIRVRIVGNTKAFVTIKTAQPGTTRSEFEYPIPVRDAQALMKLRVGRLIRKRRHIVKAGKARFEIDVFEGDHRGLVIAEIELASARARFSRPEWLGREVTHETRYYNANLATA
ncbi:MAG: CYTH domain-containing protein [Xanthobacteraceae bacterium]|nr:CYTH domain-containing protein [Xanthobacteraceae bacterium]